MIRGPGRPPKHRNIYSYEALVIGWEEVVLDTSFVLEVLLAGQKRHASAADCVRTLEAENVTVYFNELLVAELLDQAYTIPLRERGRTKRRHDARTRRHIIAAVREASKGWDDLLKSLDSVSVTVGEVIGTAEALMETYGLASYDAVHAATADYVDVPRILTFDRDFARMPEDQLAVLTDNDSVPKLRRERSRRLGWSGE